MFVHKLARSTPPGPTYKRDRSTLGTWGIYSGPLPQLVVGNPSSVVGNMEAGKVAGIAYYHRTPGVDHTAPQVQRPQQRQH